MLEEELEAKAWQLSYATANRITAVEKSVTKIAGGLVGMMELQPPSSRENIYPLLERLVKDNEEVSGIAVIMAASAPAVHRDGAGIMRGDLGDQGYNYSVQDWYVLPRILGRPNWSEPYLIRTDKDSLMVTYSLPYNANLDKDSFIGVVKCDVSLQWLNEMLLALPLGKNGYAFLLSRNGTYIAHPNKSFILKENIFSRAEEQGNFALRQLGRDMVKGQSAFLRYDSIVSDEKGWLLYQPIPSTAWVLGVFFPQEEMTAKVVELSRKEAAIGLIGFLLLLPLILLIAQSITRPLRELDQAARVLATGNLDAPLPQIDGKDEVARLANSFTMMRNELKVHLEMLEETAMSRERIDSELRIARDIQMGLVPNVFPPFPQRKDFELYALMHPAREVGGDFYDFSMLDDEHLYIAIGDVSGKGIPAALFMAVTRTYLRALLQADRSPGSVLTRLNDELTINNDYCMFVTVFCLIIHLPSGTCRFANGGHNLPLLIHADGNVDCLPKTRGVALGAMEGVVIAEDLISLSPGETLFLYTDGVNEAMNRQGEFFGDPRMIAELAGVRPRSCQDLLDGMSRAVEGFADGAEQSDDITMTAFHYKG